MQKDSKNYNLIVIEDNLGDFVLLENYLLDKIENPNITHFERFNKFNKFIRTTEIEFDAILLDLSLPDKNGLDLINAVLETKPNIPVIVLTGYSDLNFAVKSLGLGISDYLLKDELNGSILHKSLIYNIERNKNLVQLKESENLYFNLFQLSPFPIYVYDEKTELFIDANKTAEELYGYSHQEFLTINSKDIVLETMDIPFKTNSKNDLNIQIHKKKKGDILYVNVRSNNIIFKKKEAIIIIVNDITESLKHSKAIELQNEKLKDIAWTQSHLVRAPLSKILGLINLVQEDTTITNEKKELLQHLNDAAVELDKIVKEIIQKSKEILP